MNLILLEPGEVSDSGDVTLSGARAAHLSKVLRVAPGHQVRVGVLDGPRGLGTVRRLADGTIGLRCAFETNVPPPPRVDLLLALPRPKVMRRLWAQLAALGVGRIVITNAERVERNYFDTHVLSPECYRPLLVEGLQQAQDTRLPTVSIHRNPGCSLKTISTLYLAAGFESWPIRPQPSDPAKSHSATQESGSCSPSDRRAGGALSN